MSGQYTEDGIPRWMDTWNFYEDIKDNPDPLVPKDNNNLIKARSRWLAIRDRVDLFYSLFTDEQIEEYNVAEKKRESERQRKADEAREPPKKAKDTTGYIYVIKSEAGHHKVGKAKDPWSRHQTIGTEHAHKTTLLYVARCLEYAKVERLLHKALAEYRMNGEWFSLPPDKLDWLLWHDWVDDLGLRAIVTDCERIP